VAEALECVTDLKIHAMHPCGNARNNATHLKSFAIVINFEPRGPIALKPRTAVRYAELAVVHQPAARIDMAQYQPSHVATPGHDAACAIAERYDCNAGRGLEMGVKVIRTIQGIRSPHQLLDRFSIETPAASQFYPRNYPQSCKTVYRILRGL
jgi:hypothetical protein